MRYAGVMDKETRTAFADLKAYIGEQTRHLDERVENLEFESSELNVMLIDQFRTIDLRFESIDLRFESIDRRFESIDRRFDSIDRRFDGIDGRFDGIDGRFEGLADEITERVAGYIGVLLEEQKAANKAFRDEMRGHRGMLDDHETRLDRLETPPPRPGTSTAA